MSLQSQILAGSPRLEQATSGGPSIKIAPPADDVDAVRRIQKALVALGIPLPLSFPSGTAAEPDGKFGNETFQAVILFQKRVFPSSPSEWDGRVGKKTLEKMDALLPKGAGPAPVPTETPFICGPDVTEQIAMAWAKIQSDFFSWTQSQKIQACNTILLPFKRPDDPSNSGIPTNLEELKQKIQQYSDIDGWDTLPLFQGSSDWLRTPPVYDPLIKGPCATPSSDSIGGDASDPFDPKHEDANICSNTVQVAGQCWLNGTVNYGTFGIMVRLCSDFAASDWTLRLNPTIRTIYSLAWAETLIRAYKRFGQNPEGAVLPIAWTEATFYKGPRGTPSIPGNRPKCKCSCGCKGDVVKWDYIWKPIKSGGRPTR